MLQNKFIVWSFPSHFAESKSKAIFLSPPLLQSKHPSFTSFAIVGRTILGLGQNNGDGEQRNKSIHVTR